MVERMHAGIRMGLLQKRCNEKLFHMLTVGALALMSYALAYEAGNLVNLPNKSIGFYNFCLWNDTAGELQCLDSKHLQAKGISVLQMALARVCVYTCLVFILFCLAYVVIVKCKVEREEWHIICIITVIETILLSGGLGMFILQTSQWIDPSDFTGGFLALLGTQVLLLLQICIVCITCAKHTHTS